MVEQAFSLPVKAQLLPAAAHASAQAASPEPRSSGGHCCPGVEGALLLALAVAPPVDRREEGLCEQRELPKGGILFPS